MTMRRMLVILLLYPEVGIGVVRRGCGGGFAGLCALLVVVLVIKFGPRPRLLREVCVASLDHIWVIYV